ncbi:WD40 repeat domain-containing protein [Micromonospora carbonacea]|uniref:WD40 repeat n=1 Tax=Micromonospora carbonacea TaxID=47853 RepID=A0A1C4ZH30_9ACTN|nr:WD40 repeat domain-containing protein [Micromonospora carbonacea]SCF32340.1 WD40 repeat [Micromonospora carbonacea]
MTDLAGVGVRVLLIGTARHDGPLLASVPAAARSVEALRERLLDRARVRPANLRLLLDAPDAATMARAIAEEAGRADTVLLIYYVGHGLLGPGGELYLAAASTDRLVPGLAAHQALAVAAVREAVSTCRAASVVVVLDCCFSGRAVAAPPPPGPGPAFTLPAAQGVYWLGAASGYASAPPDREHTTLTGALIDLLDRGDPRGPRLLTLDAVYDHLFRAMRAGDHPLPQRQAGNRSGDLVVAMNAAHPAGPEPEDTGPDEPAAGPCPYPGLAAFGVEDAGLFHGREEATDRLVAAAAGALDARQPLIVVGASGAGKTSLLHAGLLARLRAGTPELPGCVGWPWLVLTVGEHPLEALAARLDPGGVGTADRIRRDPAVAVALLGALPQLAPPARLVLMVDQFERLFTVEARETERRAFLRAIAAIAGPPAGDNHALVLLALRADLYGRAAAHPELTDPLSDHQFLLGPMDAAQLRAAVEQPAASAGLILDDGLPELILHELGASGFQRPHAGVLPLLAHTLWATWGQRAGARLTVAGYRRTGGVAQALATTADTAYAALDDAGREAIRRMLPRLVRVDDEAMDTAHPVDRGALLHGVPDADAAERALARFAEARLVTLDRDTVRISHEALLHGWPLLRGWIDADRDWLRTRQQLAADAESWRRAGGDPSLLYRGTRLAAVQDRAAAAHQGDELPPALAGFLAASRRQEGRAARVRRATVAGLVVLLLVAVTGGVGALAFQRQAAEQRDVALTRLLVAQAESLRESQPGLAKQLGLVAYDLDKASGAGAIFAGQETPGVFGAEEPAHELTLSGDGGVLAFSTGRVLGLRGLPDGRRGRVDDLGDRRPGPIALTPDARLLVAALHGATEAGDRIRTWRVTGSLGAVPAATLTVPDARVNALAVSPDGRLLAAALASGMITLWRLAPTGAAQRLTGLRAHPEWVDSIAFSPDGRTLASTGDDGKLRLWALDDPARPARRSQVASAPAEQNPATRADRDYERPAWLQRVSFDSSGRFLASPGDGGTVAVWDVHDPRRPGRLATGRAALGSGEIIGIDFGAGNQVVTVAYRDATQLYRFVAPDPAAGLDLEFNAAGRLAATDSGAPAIRWSPVGLQLLRPSVNGVEVWDVADPWRPGARRSLPNAPGGFRMSMAFSPTDPGLIVVAGTAGTQLWRHDDPSGILHTKQLAGLGGAQGGGLALSPDGALLATTEPAGDLVSVRLRRTADPLPDAVSTITDLDNGAIELAFSPDGRLLAVADNAEYGPAVSRPPTVKIYDISRPGHPERVASLPGAVWQLAFSPTGRLLAGFTDDAVLTWNIADPRLPVAGQAHPLSQRSLLSGGAFHPDGTLLMAGDSLGALRTWRVAGDRLVDPPTVVRTNGDPDNLAFSRNGQMVAFEGRDGRDGDSRVELWDVRRPERPVMVGALAFTDVSLGSSALGFTPTGDELVIMEGDGFVTFWDVDPERVATRICASIGDPITREQWKRYVPGLPYRPPCG